MNARTTARRDIDLGGREAVDVSGFLLLPGLINSHDHLEFNLFPHLGHGPYRNSMEWAKDIHRPDATPVREHLQIPKPVRLRWGGIKNLLSGVTTVAHHNPYDAAFDGDFPVRVVKDFDWAHSLAFSPDLVEKYRSGRSGRPFIVHAAEGVDEASANEIERLAELGVLSERTVLVHALAVRAADIAMLLDKGVSIVWCPSSNLRTYGRTLSKAVLRSQIPIALGSDSAISAAGDLMDEIAIARHTGIEPEEIYSMVTCRAAQILRLHQAVGCDWVGVRDCGQSPAEAVCDLHPEFVVVRKRVRAVREDSAERFPGLASFHPIAVEGRGKWLVDADIPALMKAPAEALRGPIRLAGRPVLV